MGYSMLLFVVGILVVMLENNAKHKRIGHIDELKLKLEDDPRKQDIILTEIKRLEYLVKAKKDIKRRYVWGGVSFLMGFLVIPRIISIILSIINR